MLPGCFPSMDGRVPVGWDVYGNSWVPSQSYVHAPSAAVRPWTCWFQPVKIQKTGADPPPPDPRLGRTRCSCPVCGRVTGLCYRFTPSTSSRRLWRTPRSRVCWFSQVPERF